MDWEKLWRRHVRRRETFEAHGLSEDHAWDLAEAMFDRDRDPDDDRRICFECKNFNKLLQNCAAKHFGTASAPYRFVLARCGGFEIKEKT